MLESLSLSSSGAGGGGGSGMFCLFLCAELLSTELSFLYIILVVVSSPTSNRFRLTSLVDVQLQLFVCKSDFSVFSKAVFGRGVLLHVSSKVSGYFGWKGTHEVFPSFFPQVGGSLDDYHRLPHRLVDSIYQSHQLLVLDLLRQWLVSWYSDLLETKVLSPGEFIFGEIHAALSTSILPWVILVHQCLIPVGHDPFKYSLKYEDTKFRYK